MNGRLLSDFRIDHADALDELFTQVIATLVDKKPAVSEPHQPRRSAGAWQRGKQQLSSGRAFAATVEQVSCQQVTQLRKQLDSPPAVVGL